MKHLLFILTLALVVSGLRSSAQGRPDHQLIHPKDSGATTHPAHELRYRLGEGSEQWDAAVRERVVKAMDAAIAIYNANDDGAIAKTITAFYSPGTPTADGNYNGSVRFGGQIGTRVALHEIAHTLGIGTHNKWWSLVKDGQWTGEYALRQLREFDGPDAVLHADHQHFWPYGLNYDKEGGEENFKRHVKMVRAFRIDLGIDPVPTTAP